MSATVERTVGGRIMSFETGILARQATGSVLARYGDTVVLAAVVEGSPKVGADVMDMVPLTVDYRERTHAAGKFPGGFIKRETRPSTKEVLTCRLIDRPIRPLFPEEFANEVQIAVTVFSADRQNDPDVLAINAASAALMVSGIPFLGPVAAVRVARIDGAFVANPTYDQLRECDLQMVISGTAEGVTMVEGGAFEVAEAVVLDAIEFGVKHIREITAMQKELAERGGKPVRQVVPKAFDPVVQRDLDRHYLNRLTETLQIPGKKAREAATKVIINEAVEKYCPEGNERIPKADCYEMLGKMKHAILRKLIFDGKRADGRGLNDVRPINSRVGLLPCAHGSAVFTRGETQALVTAVLGTPSDAQIVDGLHDEYSQKFYLHYNFPGYSVGECKQNRGPGRREIGHGHLAERAIEAVLPSPEDFPYTMRVISDITESNGSSSMASVCGGTLALMDAGVPLKAPVAGVAMGLVKDGDEVRILTDILGTEDSEGDMDFKVAGTADGITAIQMDIKITNMDLRTMEQALERARVARLHILDEMAKCMTRARPEVSPLAPRMTKIQIPQDKIGAVIGPGGKVIRKIEEQTGAKLEIEDTGWIIVSGPDGASVDKAVEWVQGITEEVKIGKVYKGEVCSTREFGAFVKLHPSGQEGMVHISELGTGFVSKVQDIVAVGDQVMVKVISIDDTGRIRLSRKQVLLEEEGAKPAAAPVPAAAAAVAAPVAEGVAEEAPAPRAERLERSDRWERGEAGGAGAGRRDERPARDARPVRDERPMRDARPVRDERPMRDDRPARDERPMRDDRPVRDERPMRDDRPVRDERPVRDDRPVRDERPMRDDRPARDDRPIRDERPARDDRPMRDDRPARDARPRDDRGPRDERPMRDDRPRSGDRPPRTDDRGSDRGFDRGGDRAPMRDRGGDRGHDRERPVDRSGPPPRSGDRGPSRDRSGEPPRGDRGPRDGGRGREDRPRDDRPRDGGRHRSDAPGDRPRGAEPIDPVRPKDEDYYD